MKHAKDIASENKESLLSICRVQLYLIQRAKRNLNMVVTRNRTFGKELF